MAAMPNQLPHRIFLDEAKAAAAAAIPPPNLQPWIPDERDSFISWLRSEFAAANAMIDAMCQHLPVVASIPGEYDHVLHCVRQRRYNWTAVLHMQQYFSVEEVVLALQQAALKRRQFHHHGIGSDPPPPAPSPAPPVPWADSTDSRARQGSNRGDKKENFVAEANSITSSKVDGDTSAKSVGKGGAAEEKNLIAAAGNVDNEAGSCKQQDSSSIPVDRAADWQRTAQGTSNGVKSDQDIAAGGSIKVSRNFQSLENVDGRLINAVEGLRICENVFTTIEMERMVSSLGDLQGVGRKVELGSTGYRILGGKRFLKGKSNELVADTNEDPQKSSSQDDSSESLPEILQFIADRLVEQHIIPSSKRPDSYIINFLGEGGYLPPQTNNQEFDQPFCIINLQSDCSMVFGRFIAMESPREFRGQFKILASVGSVIVLQGNSAKLARYAVPALPSKRCCLILGKTLAKRYSRNMGFQRSSSSGGLINTNIRPPGANNNTGSIGGTPPSNSAVVSSSMQPGFPAPGLPTSPAAAPPSQGGPFPPLPLQVMVPGWSPVPRPGRFSGTGVFLPYAAPNGPGRPSSNHRGKGPVLQKMNSLPASFRSSQNGPSSSSPGNGVKSEPGTSSGSNSTAVASIASDETSSSSSNISDSANNFAEKL